MQKSVSLFELLLKNNEKFLPTINFEDNQVARGEFNMQELTKTMRKIRFECEKQFPEFTDLGYKLRMCKYIPLAKLGIFICGTGTIGKVCLKENSVLTKNLQEIRLLSFTLSHHFDVIYTIGKNLSKNSSFQIKLCKITLSLFALTKEWHTNQLITEIFYCEEEDKIFALTDKGVFLVELPEDSDELNLKEIFLGEFSCFKYSMGEWLLGDKSGQIIRINKENLRFTVEAKGPINLVKYSRSGKLVVALMDKQAVLYSLSLVHKRTVDLKDKPIGVVVVDEDKHILVSTDKGHIVIINLYSEQVLYVPVHRDEIVSFWMDDQTKEIYTFGKDSKISKFNFPNIIDSRTEGFQSINFVFCGSNPDLIFIESKTRIIRWNFIYGGSEEFYVSNSEIAKCLNYNQKLDFLIFSEIDTIITMKVATKTIVKKIHLPIKIHLNHCKFSIDGDYFFTIAAQNNFIYCYHTNSDANPFRLKGHEGKINCQMIIKGENILVSGGNDCRVILWDFKFEKKRCVFEGHKGAVTCLTTTREANKILSGSKDSTIKVWDWRNKQLIITLKSHSSPLIKIKVDNLNQMFSISAEGTIIYWNLRAYVKIFKYNLNSEINDFSLSDNFKWGAYSDLTGLRVMYIPTHVNIFDVIGPNNECKYEYIYYLYKVLKGESVEYDRRWDDWAVLPYQYNTLLFYSYANLYKHLKLSINSGSLLIPAPNADPYSIVAIKNYERCLKVFYDSTKTMLDSNLYSLSFISQDAIVYLNKLGHSHLHIFYKHIFRKYPNNNFPKFIDKTLLPRTIYSKYLHPQHTAFFTQAELDNMDVLDNSMQEDKGDKFNYSFKTMSSYEMIPVLLYTSAIRMDFMNGSKDSIEFITSILNCSNKEIFKTKYIQTILNEKWKILKKYQLFQASIYTLYLVFMSLYLIFFNGNTVAYSLLLISATGLFCFDLAQMYTAFTLFWKDIWNYLDLSRSLFYLLYSISFYTESYKSYSNEILMIICFISLCRGIAFFRIFDDTRYFIKLIVSVFIDIKSFAIILSYSTISFSLIRMIQDGERSFFDHFKDSIMVNLGDNSIESNNSMSWIIFVIMGIINIIVLLNMLIAIMGETFNKVRENSAIANYVEIAQMVLEIETVYIKKNLEVKKMYMQLCEPDYSEDGEENEIVSDLKKIKKQLKEIINNKNK